MFFLKHIDGDCQLEGDVSFHIEYAHFFCDLICAHIFITTQMILAEHVQKVVSQDDNSKKHSLYLLFTKVAPIPAYKDRKRECGFFRIVGRENFVLSEILRVFQF